jgi:hypothetical protein
MEPFEDKLRDAVKAEFGELTKARYQESRSADAIAEMVRHAEQALRYCVA